MTTFCRPLRGGLALLVVAAVEIRRARRELAGAGVDHLVRRPHAERPAMRARREFRLAAQRAELAVGEAHALHARIASASTVGSARYARSASSNSCSCVEEPRIDPGDVVQLGRRHAQLHGALELEDALRRRPTQRAAQRLARLVGQAIVDQALAHRPAGAAGLERAQRLLERLLERAPDGHRLAHRLHLRGESGIGTRRTSRTRSAGTSRRRSRAPARSWPAWSS